jgi:hypothetical protein
MVWFTATAGAAERMDDINTYAVVVADDGGMRIEFQRAIEEFDEQDRALGMDTYCLCTHTGATHYGGVTGWSVKDGVLRVELDADAALELEVDRALAIELCMSTEEIEAVTAGIERVLTGFATR